jgi:hypothetical protein
MFKDSVSSLRGWWYMGSQFPNTRAGANFIEVFHDDHHSSAAKPPRLGSKEQWSV